MYGVPDISVINLLKTFDFTTEYVGRLIMSISFLLVTMGHFQRMVVMPFPDLQTRSIANFSVTEVVVNTLTQQYVDVHDAMFQRNQWKLVDYEGASTQESFH